MNDENVGRVVAQKYELVRLLGKGGMGAVYEGRNQIGKRVAVKLLLKAEFTQSPELTARFFREAQTSASVESRHVVDVYDTGVDAETGYPFIIMAYLAGEDLEHVMERLGPLNPVAAVRVVSQAAVGLAKTHAAGITHRDIKPANLFLALDDNESVVKILDFGIAKLTGPGIGEGEVHGLTQTGAMLGTPLYMSPEQAQGLKTLDARSDIWSLGMCLYHALAGKLPFEDVDTIGKLIVAIVARDVTPILTLAPWVHPDLAAIVHHALERDVEKRIQTARDFVAALSPFAGGSLAITPNLLTGVKESLDATLVPGSVSAALARSAPGIASSTTAGFSAAPGTSLPMPGSSRKAMTVAAVIGVVLVGVGAIKLGKHEREAPAAAASATSTPPIVPAASASPAPAPRADPVDDVKVGVLTIKMPEGCSVKVDGFVPGSPEARGASRLLADGRLELRGEFQRKFLVAVFEKGGKRVMVQDVYLYDNRLDPDSIDSSVGAVAVEKPRRKVTAPSAPSAPPVAVSAAPTASAVTLPTRF
ncbi:MAG: protein kinase [Polyangiales bacterium]